MLTSDRPIPVQLRIVLVGTSHPGNIGAAARAMQTMGLESLHLVAPECDPFAAESQVRAAGAEHVMSHMVIHATLADALADCHTVYGCTARKRSVALPQVTPRQAAPRLVEAAMRGAVAVLFGRERTGLENSELQRCHAAVHIPTDAEFGSLNLAAAVQVVAYELRLAALARIESEGYRSTAESAGTPASMARPAEVDQSSNSTAEPLANQAALERFFEHLEQTLIDIDFHKGRHSTTLMHRLRRLFLRANMDAREVRMLRGILAESQRMARLARPS